MKKNLLYILTMALLAISCQEEIPVTGITLMPEYLELMEGETSNVWASLIPENATDRSVIWASTDENVVTVSKGIVTAGEAGLAQITVSTMDGLHSATCLVRVMAMHEAVDMGLSVKWASVNIYAESPEDPGDYFAWGEIASKPYYSWNNYQWGEKDDNAKPLCGMTGYNGDAEGGDGLSALLPEDDAASKIWGHVWRTPTIDEFKELFDANNCIVQWDESRKGLKITSKQTANSIFLPAAGYREGYTAAGIGDKLRYWSSSLYTPDPTNARYIYVYNGEVFRDRTSRHIGLPIRAVTE